MAILVVFWKVLLEKVAKLCPIDFTIGLPINIGVSDVQYKFEVHISKNEGGQNPKLLGQNGPAATLVCDFKRA